MALQSHTKLKVNEALKYVSLNHQTRNLVESMMANLQQEKIVTKETHSAINCFYLKFKYACTEIKFLLLSHTASFNGFIICAANQHAVNSINKEMQVAGVEAAFKHTFWTILCTSEL